MALLFRKNVISKRLTNICYSFIQNHLPPSPRRSLFTNSCSVYFAKKKVDDLKIPKCPDFEQYFTKAKKGDVKKEETLSAKRDDDKRKPPIEPPIFGNQTSTPPPRTLASKYAPVAPIQQINGGKFFPKKAPILNEKKLTTVQQSPQNRQKTPPPVTKSQPPIFKKDSKSLNDFTQFTLPPRSLNAKNSSIESQGKDSEPLSEAQAVDDSKTKGKSGETVDDSKTKEKSGETVSLPISTDSISGTNKNYFWLAAIAAGICALGLAFSRKKSSSIVPESIPDEKFVNNKTEIKDIPCPLVFPKKVPYLIIGGGTASWSAFRAIKDHVPNAKVLVVSNETSLPYMRPLLPKAFHSAESNCDESFEQNDQKIYFEPTDYYTDPMQLLNQENGGISVLRDRTAKYLKLCERKVVLTDGTEIEYDECLLATGSRPRNLVIFQTAKLSVRKKISFFRSLSDFQSIKDIADESESIAVIGGGFVASEIAFALTTYAAHRKKLKIYQIFHETGNMGMTLPRYLSEWIRKQLIAHGLFVIPNTQVDSVQMENSKLKLGLLNGQLIVVDHVIVAIGSQPDVAFAQLSGLKLADRNCGIVVNENLEALPHLYVAGDAACLPGYIGKETAASYDHAIASGRLAGENMTGKGKAFTHQSMFSSNVAPDISFESVGVIDAALKTVGVFSNGSALTTNINTLNKGVVFYLKNDVVVGIVLWNIFNKINIARQVISEGKKLYELNEVAKRFEIQE